MSVGKSVGFLATGALLFACSQAGDEDGSRGRIPGKFDSSLEAVFLDFEFDGELATGWSFDHENTIESQLLYTVGQLNGDHSVGRLDKLELTNIETETVDGRTVIRYHARMPVAWGESGAPPDSYTFKLPRNTDRFADFTDAYSHDCVDWSAHDVTSGIFWYYYRPAMSACSLAADDIVVMPVTVSPSAIETTGKFPEYHKVWEDDALKVVAIFGKNEEDATSNYDAGIRAYNQFASKIRAELAPYGLVTDPPDAPSVPGNDNRDITYSATLPDGRRVEVVSLLVDGVRVAGPEFDERYEQLTPDADIIGYAGHSGLGANIRALARKGEWATGQYTVVLMNGCDTYAYVDSALYDAHAAVNPDDAIGTKYLDIVTNAMPAYFHSNAENTMAFIRALMDRDEPMTFEQIFAGVDPVQVQLVSGEEDNVYVPGYPGGGGEENWQGMSESGTVAANAEDRYATTRLAAGRYVFDLSGTGDADLYVRAGAQPTTGLYDCRPYRWGSTETCVVDLPSAAEIHIMVRGWDPSSDYQLDGRAE